MKDVDNFKFKLGKWNVEMIDGELTINECSYEKNEDDPTYDLVLHIFEHGFYKMKE